ncbi:Gfo/Idh/MocA family protein [Oceanitalea stevensii]|uniref:Gfo/Idh/MocA family oxidoreductase n=1 Tax=Oceanitalea stevensii TaxID=2763072 RepID=A0ABR8Z3F3_9MICO|nr:Gfo/Idh/MocA family oxidoreductase [Oceanitalea stevensii]MBD8062854.1 Gfo/Idh/MocA family oxidoreductase [Oceanitalea stevensii]
MTTAERIGVGIVGLGGIGAIHARALAELGERVRLVAYSGGGPDVVAAAGWHDAVRVAHEEVAQQDGVDVVAICSPTQTHAALALAALEAGRHVVVEKPLAVTVGEAEAVARLAEERGLLVSMVSQRRFEPEHVHVQRLLRSGELGQLRVASTEVHWHRDDAYYAAAPWRTSMAGGGGSLMNQGVHNVDLLRWLCGPVESVTAQYATLAHDMDAEDTTVATVRFASGALGLISTSTATPPGSPATIMLRLSTGVVELGQGSVERWEVGDVPPPAGSSREISSGAAAPLAIGHAGHLNQWRDIVRALDDGAPPAVGARDAVETVRLLCAIYEAAETGRATNPATLT